MRNDLGSDRVRDLLSDHAPHETPARPERAAEERSAGSAHYLPHHQLGCIDGFVCPVVRPIHAGFLLQEWGGKREFVPVRLPATAGEELGAAPLVTGLCSNPEH